jgi:hypothetical protein
MSGNITGDKIHRLATFFLNENKAECPMLGLSRMVNNKIATTSRRHPLTAFARL